MPPFGHKTHLRVFIDPGLLQYDEVWAAAGTWNDVFGIEPHKLVDASEGVVVDLERGWFHRSGSCRTFMVLGNVGAPTTSWSVVSQQPFAGRCCRPETSTSSRRVRLRTSAGSAPAGCYPSCCRHTCRTSTASGRGVPGSSRRGPAPSTAMASSGFNKVHRSNERQPHPMHVHRSSRIRWR